MVADNLALTQFTVSAIVVTVINWLKASQYFPWITKEKTTLLRLLSVLGAAATSVGITWAWNPAMHSLTITGITLTAVLMLLWTTVKSFAMNEVLFQATKKNGSNGVKVAASASPVAKTFHS